MEKEISSGAMLGIVLIALAAIIGLGFGVFAIAKGTANEGVTGVQENLQGVAASAYTDYDQKIVTGTQVISAMNNFEGKNVAILIATQASKDIAGKASSSNPEETFDEGAGIRSSYTDLSKAVPVVETYEMESGGVISETPETANTTTSGGTAIGLKFINYNALLAGAGSDGSSHDAYTGKVGVIGFDSNCWRTANGFGTKSGKVLFNNITGNVNKSGMMEYVPSGSRFQAYLVKDQSSTVMGVAFEQLNSK